MKQFIKLLPAAALILTTALTSEAMAADDTQFTFAPAPVTKIPVAGESAQRWDFTFMSIDSSDPITALGLTGNSRDGTSDGAKSDTFGLVVLSSESGELSGLMSNFNWRNEKFLSSDRKTLGGVGIPLNMTVMSMETSSKDMNILNMSLGIDLSIQHHLDIGNGAELVPYVGYNANYGVSSYSATTTSTIGGTSYSSTNSDSDTYDYTALTLGFDITFGDISLGGLTSSGSNDNVTILTFGMNM